jgi:hypothetical protein
MRRLETGGYNTLFSLARGVELGVEVCSWVNHLRGRCNVSGEGAKKSVEADLLNALLLSSHFLFLLDYFRLVFEGERERETDEEG